MTAPSQDFQNLDALALLLSALRFSADKHRDQMRKDGRTPYINHPIAVAETLRAVGKVTDANLLAAALLHDVVEDTGTRPEELEAAFGADIRDLVLEVSDDKRLSKQARKQRQVESAPHKSNRAKTLKLADFCCNIHDTYHNPPSHWPLQRRLDYLDWCAQVARGLAGVNPALERRLDQLLKSARAALTGTAP